MSTAIHFARILPALSGRGARPVALCSAIGGLRTAARWHAVTCQRCLAQQPVVAVLDDLEAESDTLELVKADDGEVRRGAKVLQQATRLLAQSMGAK
jgi:hypothetical protein